MLNTTRLLSPSYRLQADSFFGCGNPRIRCKGLSLVSIPEQVLQIRPTTSQPQNGSS